jgi:hypothetical protein
MMAEHPGLHEVTFTGSSPLMPMLNNFQMKWHHFLIQFIQGGFFMAAVNSIQIVVNEFFQFGGMVNR